jgi:chromosome segregation ATPase
MFIGSEIDERKKGGCALDELQAHVFLEKFDEALTVRALRTALRETGAIGEKERPKNIPLVHYLLFKYSVDWRQLVNASQGDNSKEINEAQRMLDEVQHAFAEADARASEAAAAVREAASKAHQARNTEDAAKADEAEAVARENEAREREAPFKAAQEELEAALNDVRLQEEAYNHRTSELQARSEEGGVVARNKAKAELAQHLAEDPLPLRRAKVTVEAATKKAEKARAPFEAATKSAEAARAAATASALEASKARQAAEAAKQAAEVAKQAADDAVEEARERVAEAEAYLDEIKSRPGCAHGSMWWIERELHEAKRYLPESKGGIRKV